MKWSATSKPVDTWTDLTKADGGVRNGWLATNVNSIERRSAARKRISLTGTGQASALGGRRDTSRLGPDRRRRRLLRVGAGARQPRGR